MTQPTSPAPRSLLSVPATSQRFLSSALRRGTDAVMIDLEDGVAAEDKERARRELTAFLAANHDGGPGLWVRINDPLTPEGQADLTVLNGIEVTLAGVIVPKATSPSITAATEGTDRSLLALVETAAGVEQAADVAAEPSVQGLLFGTVDYVSDIASRGGWHLTDLGWASSRLVNAAAAAGGWCLAGPHLQLEDQAGLQRAIEDDRAHGFAGTLCIHPGQIDAVNQGFRPTAEALRWAEQVLAAADEGSGAQRVNGQMIDRPVVLRAQHMLAAAASDRSRP